MRRPADRRLNPPVRPRAALGLVLAAVILFVGGCGGSSSPGQGTGGTAGGGRTVRIIARSLPGVGKVLVTSQGYALYVFAPDNHRTITCTGTCLGTWPPVMLPSGANVAAGPGVDLMLLGSDPDPAGGRVVTYNGWPLYTYADDVQPGQATGQNVDLNGGEWYVIRPSGQPLIPAS